MRLPIFHQPHSLGSPFGPESCAAFCLAGLFKMFAAAHFFLDAASFNQFSKSSNCLLYGLFITHQQLYHFSSNCITIEKTNFIANPLSLRKKVRADKTKTRSRTRIRKCAASTEFYNDRGFVVHRRSNRTRSTNYRGPLPNRSMVLGSELVFGVQPRNAPFFTIHHGPFHAGGNAKYPIAIDQTIAPSPRPNTG